MAERNQGEAPFPAHEYDTSNRSNPNLAAAITRVSWGAIFAGVVVALVILLTLNLLGLSIGLGVVDPASERDPLSGVGLGAGIWAAVSTLIALFAGGWIAGRFAGMPGNPDSFLHGVVVWGVVTLLTVYLMTSAVGGVLSGTAGILGQSAQLIGQGVTAAAPQATEAVQEQIPDDVVREIRQEAAQLLPGEQQQETQGAASAGQSELSEALDQLLENPRDITEEDRQAVVDVLVARTDMSRQEARKTVREYEQTLFSAFEEVQQTAGQAGRQVAQTSEQAAEAASSAALWAFIALVLGAIAAAGGGALGAPRDLPATPALRRE